MSRIFHVWWIVIIAVIVLALIIVWGLFSTSQTLSANNLYDAVNDSAQYAMDNSSRMDRGTFVINRKAFEKRLSEYKIKNYGKASSDGSKPSKLYVHYLVDNHGTNDGSYAGVQDGYINPNGYARDASETDDNGYSSHDSSNYLPIRAIQVTANADGHHAQNPNDITDTKDKYVATDVVQAHDTDANIDQIMKMLHNNYSKVNKSDGTPTSTRLKKNQDALNQAKSQLNNPVRHPNNTHRNLADLTDNTYNNENGNSAKLDAESNDD